MGTRDGKISNPKGGPNFVAGVSANPGGRPKGIGAYRKMLAPYTEESVELLIALMRDEDSRIRLDALKLFQDRLLGRPIQEITGAIGAVAITTDELHARLLEVAGQVGVEDDAEPTGSTH